MLEWGDALGSEQDREGLGQQGAAAGQALQEGGQGRAIISAELASSLSGEKVRFALKPNKTHIFGADGARIRLQS